MHMYCMDMYQRGEEGENVSEMGTIKVALKSECQKSRG
jgi:hypothetical protein